MWLCSPGWMEGWMERWMLILPTLTIFCLKDLPEAAAECASSHTDVVHPLSLCFGSGSSHRPAQLLVVLDRRLSPGSTFPCSFTDCSSLISYRSLISDLAVLGLWSFPLSLIEEAVSNGKTWWTEVAPNNAEQLKDQIFASLANVGVFCLFVFIHNVSPSWKHFKLYCCHIKFKYFITQIHGRRFIPCTI